MRYTERGEPLRERRRRKEEEKGQVRSGQVGEVGWRGEEEDNTEERLARDHYATLSYAYEE